MDILGHPSKPGATENADSIEVKFKVGLTWKFLPSTSEYMKSFVLAKMNKIGVLLASVNLREWKLTRLNLRSGSVNALYRD